MVDAHSEWPEVIPMTVTTAERTVIEMRKTFAVHGLPCQHTILQISQNDHVYSIM